MNGRSTRVTTGLATRVVSGRSRVPSPPARITACIAARRSSDADALVDEPRGAHGVTVEDVAAVDDDVPCHGRRDRLPVEFEELGPLGDEHDRVGVLDGVREARGAVEL